MNLVSVDIIPYCPLPFSPWTEYLQYWYFSCTPGYTVPSRFNFQRAICKDSKKFHEGLQHCDYVHILSFPSELCLYLLPNFKAMPKFHHVPMKGQPPHWSLDLTLLFYLRTLLQQPSPIFPALSNFLSLLHHSHIHTFSHLKKKILSWFHFPFQLSTHSYSSLDSKTAWKIYL